jgi:alpha-mannosidase
MPVKVYIVNHTHWDREWFLTSEYTSRWIPNLIRNLKQLFENNPSYRFLLDGQTLVIEDLIRLEPEMEHLVQELVESGCMIIGPYYSQPDWQLTPGELLIRNLQYGMQDASHIGGSMQVGWLVDTFGHISQAPQIHRLFGIQALYVWRGVPQLVPYFTWQGADGSQILAINLFGGYRNLYGVTHVPNMAVSRIIAEVKRLAPFYPSPDIPLFDGYDLEDNPEDPLAFYAQAQGVSPELELHQATPASFASLISNKKLPLPVLKSELNSGKYGATFPGALSARTYLKIMAYDCQKLLYRYCEPLAALAYLYGKPYPAQRFERFGRLLLQNSVHDCICGVSIDQVHEKMTWSYQKVFNELRELLQDSIEHVMQYFSPGEYTISTNPFSGECWLSVDGSLLRLQTSGIGIWPVTERIPIDALPSEQEETSDFTWSNDYYEALLQPDGQIRIGDAVLGELRIYRENGDTYSDERGDLVGIMYPVDPPRVIERSKAHTILEYECAWYGESAWVSTRIRLIFDLSPLVRWQIELDSSGTDLCVEMCFDTARQGEIWAGMPYDLVQRSEVDVDLLPRQPSPQLANILLGQRELGEVRTFPFHDLVVISERDNSSVVFARGLHAYRAESGVLSLTLRRSVEWLTRPDLKGRVGDAGPFFYVPDARCECSVRHELAFANLPYPVTSMRLQALNDTFQNPPLVVQTDGHGTREHWEFLREDLPLSSVQIQEDTLLARFYNPTEQAESLSRLYPETDVWGRSIGETNCLGPKKIAILRLDVPMQEAMHENEAADLQISLLNPPQWRVGLNHSMPDPAVMAQLEQKISILDELSEAVNTRLALIRAEGEEDQGLRFRLEHQYYALQRERLEYQFSLLLNRRKLEFGGNTPLEALCEIDPQIAAIGKQLNHLRIKRRIYDYVVQALN